MINTPLFSHFTTVNKINKGWSKDTKYYVETMDGERLLLRITDISEYERKKEEFEMMKYVESLDVPMSHPVDFGICDGGKVCYSLFTWCDGKDAEAIIPLLSEVEQYSLGFRSGEILKILHHIPAPDDLIDWNYRFGAKTDKRLQSYRACSLQFDGDEQMIAYVEKNRDLLKKRPQCYQHGDYHLGNMIISEMRELSIIDFNRFDYGDPWEEFNRIVWSAKISPHFATGQINGYFDGKPPIEFFRLLTFYIASNTLGSICWAESDQSDLDTMMQQSQDVMQWFDGMKSIVPTWYQGSLM